MITTPHASLPPAGAHVALGRPGGDMTTTPHASLPPGGADVALWRPGGDMSQLDALEKERLVEEFRLCLELWQTDDDAPAQPVDLHTLLAEMAALKNEVRLESRQFRSVLEELRRLGDSLHEHNQRLVRDLDRARAQAQDGQRAAERGLLLDLLDLRDRLQAGVDMGARRLPSLLARLLPGEAQFARSLGEGMALTLQRLDEVLRRHRVRAIEAVGQPLDPDVMCAVAIEAAAGLADGVVLREARRGYLRDGELLRLAEVIVNKRETKS
ncbi:MAG: nucleotide exchange factor GrpE [Betaproteobacteria bacterium]|nr:nucleotide exchange factor GrpE [Betaproteobacteria bacterium]